MSSQGLTVFRKELASMAPQFTRVLPAHLPTARLTRTIESAVAGLPALLNCDRASLWKACMSAAVFGLEVDGHQSAIIPFVGKAQFIPMVAGLITLADNAGRVIDAAVVREKDDFHYQRGTAPLIHHNPSRSHDRGADNPIVAAYCIAWPKVCRQDYVFEVLELPEIVERRDRSSGWKAFKSGKIKDSPWNTDFGPMARKSAIRALANQLPWQIQKAAELESRFDRGEIASAKVADDGGVTIDGEAIDLTAGGEGPGEGGN